MAPPAFAVKRLHALLLCALLTGCISLPAPTPQRSPLVSPMQRQYLPIAISVPNKVGVSQDIAFRNCSDVVRLGGSWHYDWSANPLVCPGYEAVPMMQYCARSGSDVVASVRRPVS
jgi:hypothetical protein